ncbi:hypothetical protein Tco_0396350 [Tanacetum coccineum]
MRFRNNLKHFGYQKYELWVKTLLNIGCSVLEDRGVEGNCLEVKVSNKELKSKVENMVEEVKTKMGELFGTYKEKSPLVTHLRKVQRVVDLTLDSAMCVRNRDELVLHRDKRCHEDMMYGLIRQPAELWKLSDVDSPIWIVEDRGASGPLRMSQRMIVPIPSSAESRGSDVCCIGIVVSETYLVALFQDSSEDTRVTQVILRLCTKSEYAVSYRYVAMVLFEDYGMRETMLGLMLVGPVLYCSCFVLLVFPCCCIVTAPGGYRFCILSGLPPGNRSLPSALYRDVTSPTLWWSGEVRLPHCFGVLVDRGHVPSRCELNGAKIERSG